METFLLAVTAIATSIGAAVSLTSFLMKMRSSTKCLAVRPRERKKQEDGSLRISLLLKPDGEVLVRTISAPGRKLSFSPDEPPRDSLPFNTRIDMGVPVNLCVRPCPQDGEPLSLKIDIGRLFDARFEIYASDGYRYSGPNMNAWP